MVRLLVEEDLWGRVGEVQDPVAQALDGALVAGNAAADMAVVADTAVHSTVGNGLPKPHADRDSNLPTIESPLSEFVLCHAHRRNI